MIVKKTYFHYKPKSYAYLINKLGYNDKGDYLVKGMVCLEKKYNTFTLIYKTYSERLLCDFLDTLISNGKVDTIQIYEWRKSLFQKKLTENLKNKIEKKNETLLTRAKRSL